MGWTYEETLKTPPDVIRRAYESRVEMLKAIFGSEEKPTQAEDPKPADKVLFALRNHFGKKKND